jgi:hypothetical protein
MSDSDVSTRRVLEAISRHLGIDVGTIRGRDRTAKVVGARAVAIILLRQRGLSYRALGDALRRDVGQVFRTHRYALGIPQARAIVEFVDRMILQEAPRTRRAVVDVEAEFARAREEAGAPPAKSTRERPR